VTPNNPDPPHGLPLTQRFVDALAYAAELHLDQSRKGSEVCYLGHLLGVCSLVLEEGGNEDQAIAALLHDAGEDRGGEAQLVEIGERYGDNVTAIVRACSDTLLEDKPDWKTRKTEYLDHLERLDDDTRASVLLVSLADKLFNARAILRDHDSVGESVWHRFTAGRDEQLWYYRSLSDKFKRLAPDIRMTGELEEAVKRLELLCRHRTAEQAAPGTGP